MKFNLDKFKNNKFVLVKEGLEKKLPSKEKRHVKNQKKVNLAIKDLMENHNHSWYDEVLIRNKKNMQKEALFYRGNVISYEEMFREADKLVSALSNYGLQKGDEVLMCVSNTPEMVYLLLACSKLGLKPNIFGSDFNKDYIKEIIKESNSKIIFMSDDNFERIKDIIDETNIPKKVVYSLTDSMNLKYIANNEQFNYVLEYDNFINYQSYPKDSVSLQAFIKEYNNGKAVIPDVSLDDDFTITYTSGSTKNGRPKALIHRVKSFNAMGRFHDADLSGNPKMHNLRSLAHIPPHSNTCLITSISDMLFQSCSVALEPIYEKEHFLDSIMLNNPNLVPATRSFWIEGMKKYLNNPFYKDLKLPYIMVPIAVGEPVSPNEERFLNKCFKKLNMGSKMVPFPVSPVTLCIGGGDCEHGGLFFTLYKRLFEKLTLSREEYGLKPFAHSNLKVLDENLDECGFNELGILVGDSICTMREYKNNQEATNNFFVKDNDGEVNGTFNVWSYIDKRGHVHFKGRRGNEFILSNGEKLQLFRIADVILEDIKHIMSCEVVNVSNKLVAYIELYPNLEEEYSAYYENAVISDALHRLRKHFPIEVSDNIYFMINDTRISYPLTGCGKRNIHKLEQDGEKIINSIESRNEKTLIKKL